MIGSSRCRRVAGAAWLGLCLGFPAWGQDAPVLVPQIGHAGDVNAVAFSPDGRTFASGSDDNTVKLWESDSGRLLRTLEGHAADVNSVSFSPDGRTLASGSADHTVKLWERESGRLLRTLEGHAASVRSVSFSPDGRTLASGSFDTSVRHWRTSDGELLTTSYAFQGQDYLTYTPEGYYVASAAGEARAAWRIVGDLYMPEAVSRTFRRPALVARKLAGLPVASPVVDLPPKLAWIDPILVTNDKETVVRLLYRGTAKSTRLMVDLNNEPLDVELPADLLEGEIPIPLTLSVRDNKLLVIAFDDKGRASEPLRLGFEYADAPLLEAASPTFFHTSGEHTFAEELTLRFQVASAKDLRALTLTQDGSPLNPGSPQRTKTPDGRMVSAYEVDVGLRVGANHFRLIAVTRDGVQVQEDLSLVRDSVSRLWVAAIGISDYQDPEVDDLLFAADDARAVHAYYRDTFGLPEDHLFLLTEEEATADKIRRLIGTRIAKEAEPADTVIIYFAGHGMKESFSGSRDPDGFAKYFLPYDGKQNDLFNTALDMDNVTERIFPRLQAERLVFIVDSCFSGKAGGRTTRRPKQSRSGPIADDFFERMAQAGRGQILFTASEANTVAREDRKLGHGVFTYYLLEGLKGKADTDGDTAIAVHELYDYVSKAVREATGKDQKPQLHAPAMGRVEGLP